jgi:hypothetical protein
MTTARYSQPCQVRMYVISVTQAVLGRVRFTQIEEDSRGAVDA